MEYRAYSDHGVVSIDGPHGSCRYESSVPLDVSRSDFVAWAALPVAMRHGESLRINGVGDSVVAQNASMLSRIWELWMPDRFRRIEVSFAREQAMPGGEGRLVLYSGGLDSTFNLMQHLAAGERPHLLTLHGLDYKYTDDERFDSLVKQTAPFVDHVSSGRITLKTDIYSFYQRNGIKPDVGHGFALFSALFLFAGRFGVGEISADYTAAQDYVVHPWGTNSYTNRFFASSTFRVETGSADSTRSEKIERLAEYPLALASMTFCKDYSKRPKNCGVCSKCVRTKAMFIAATGEAPDIFLTRKFDRRSLKQMHLTSRSEAAFFVDLYLSARRHGNLDRLPGLEKMAEAYFGGLRLQHMTPLHRTRRRLTEWLRSGLATAR